MYAPTLVQNRLERAEAHLGFRLEYHSVSEIADFAQRLERRHQDAYRAAQQAAQASESSKRAKVYQTTLLKLISNAGRLSKFEVRWMQNERALVSCDAAYFLEHYYWIINTENTLQLFNFATRPGQEILFGCLGVMEAMNVSIELLDAKARQLGVSTEMAGLQLQKICFQPGVNSVIASADSPKTREMVRKILGAYDKLPWWMRPVYSRRVESDQGFIYFGDSGITFQHGEQTNPIAMGNTVIGYHLCLSARTLVRTADSRVKPICEMKPGDMVITETGRIARVKQVCKSRRSDELTSEIVVWGTPTPLSCTRDHPILTDNGWRNASDVTVQDRIIYPVRKIAEAASPISIAVFNKHQRWVRGENNARLEMREFEPSFALGRLVGLYLAEGSIQSKERSSGDIPGAVYFTIHEEEISTVESWCREVFGQELRQTLKRVNSKTAQVVLNRRGFAEWLVNHFGVKDQKRVPDLCWDLGVDFCRGVVYGYLFGDGHYAVRDNGVYATSVRVAIALGVRELIASLGFGWSQVAYRDAGQWYNRNCRECWILTIAGETARSLRAAFGYTVHPVKRESPWIHWRWCDQGVSVSVASTGDGFQHDFYDLEVDDSSHTFLTACGIVHNSEVSSYPNPEELIEMGLFKAVHPSPRVLGVLESTCKGNTGWWHDYYWFCKAKWKQGLSRLMALFLPFYCATNMYPNATELLAHPVPRGWKPEDETQRMMREAEAYVASNDVLAKVLMKDGKQWKMSREQAWYWEWNFLEARSKGQEKLWFQEMPHSDRAAFQSSYESVFGKEIIATVESSRDSQYGVYGLTGQSIEECHEPDADEVDHTLDIIPIRYTNRRNISYHWDAIPLEWAEPFEAIAEIRDDESHMGKLFIWKHPEPGYDYSIGIRTSNGINTDPTVIAVSRRARHQQDHDVQAAEFRDIAVSHVEAFAWGMAIAAYYGKYMTPEFGMLRHREPYIAIEQVRSVGDTCQLQMQKMGYRRFHRMTRYDSKMEDMRKSKAKKLGWYSFCWSEPMLTDGFVVLVRNGWYQVNSPYTIWEMDHWEVHSTESGKDKYLPSDEATAHGLYANALAAFCPNDQKALAERTMKQFMKTGYDTAKPSLDLSPTLAGLTVSTITTPPDPRISRLTLMGR